MSAKQGKGDGCKVPLIILIPLKRLFLPVQAHRIFESMWPYLPGAEGVSGAGIV